MARDRMTEAGDERASRSFPVVEDMPFQRANWAAERVGWCVLVLVVAMALAGVFSIGPVSSHTASDQSGQLAVESGRFQRIDALASIRVSARAAAPAEELVLRIAPSFLDAFTINAMQPQPFRAEGGAEGLDLAFAAPSGGELIVHLSVRPSRAGLIRTGFALPGRASVDLAYFIYP